MNEFFNEVKEGARDGMTLGSVLGGGYACSTKLADGLGDTFNSARLMAGSGAAIGGVAGTVLVTARRARHAVRDVRVGLQKSCLEKSLTEKNYTCLNCLKMSKTDWKLE